MRIFIISLKGSSRRLKITTDLEAEHLPFEFFDAVDARTGVPPKYESRINRKAAARSFARPLSKEEFGVALSHALLYEKIVRENISDAIILEDDAILTADFFKLVKSSALEKSNIDMAFLYHYYCFARKKKYTLKDFIYRKPLFMPFGAVGYYINDAVACTLKKHTQIIRWTADFPVALHCYHKVVAFQPRLVKHPAPLQKQTTIKTRPKINKVNFRYRLEMLLGIGYFHSKHYYGSWWQFLQKVYGRLFCKNISPTVEN